MKKYIRYTHAAATGYNPDVSHNLEDVVKIEGLERAKILFTPINFKWEDLDKKEEVKEAVKEQGKRFK